MWFGVLIWIQFVLLFISVDRQSPLGTDLAAWLTKHARRGPVLKKKMSVIYLTLVKYYLGLLITGTKKKQDTEHF